MFESIVIDVQQNKTLGKIINAKLDDFCRFSIVFCECKVMLLGWDRIKAKVGILVVRTLLLRRNAVVREELKISIELSPTKIIKLCVNNRVSVRSQSLALVNKSKFAASSRNIKKIFCG